MTDYSRLLDLHTLAATKGRQVKEHRDLFATIQA